MKRDCSTKTTKTKKKLKTIIEIPTYVLFNISCFLPYSDVIKFQRVSKSWKEKISSNIFDRFRNSEFNYKTIIPNIYNQEEFDQNLFFQKRQSKDEAENIIYKNEDTKIYSEKFESYCHRLVFYKNNRRTLIQNVMSYKLIGDRLYVVCVFKEIIGEKFTPFIPSDECYSGLFCILLKKNPIKWIRMENFGIVCPPFNGSFTHDDFFYGIFNCFIGVDYSKSSSFPRLILIFGSSVGVYNLNTLKRIKIKRISIDSHSVKQFDIMDSKIILLQNYRDPDECPACGSINLSFISIYNINIDLISSISIDNGTSKKLIFSPINKYIFCITKDNILKCFDENGNEIWDKKELECTNIGIINENSIALCIHDVLDIKSGKIIK